MQADAKSLDALLEGIWARLTEATTQGGPWRTPVLATCADNRPAARTVVLRAAVPATRQLCFHTDARSAKVDQLRDNPWTEWVFNDPVAGVQVRAAGGTRIVAGNETEWAALSAATRRLFGLAAAPGTRRMHQAGRKSSDGGREHFLTGRTVVESLHWLKTHADGNLAARFQWTGRQWAGQWVMP
ncbi:MAG: pyridoxamine 5'-phosphate oxidase family protein [Gammaproteobacteria bacterium]